MKKSKKTIKKKNPDYLYSNEVPWDLDRNEDFWFGEKLPNELKIFERKSLDVTKAKEILSTYPYIVKKINIEKYFKYTNDIAKKYDPSLRTNFDIPIILVNFKNKKFPIDGWSRILKAKNFGIYELSAIQLTEKISQEVFKNRNNIKI